MSSLIIIHSFKDQVYSVMSENSKASAFLQEYTIDFEPGSMIENN